MLTSLMLRRPTAKVLVLERVPSPLQLQVGIQDQNEVPENIDRVLLGASLILRRHQVARTQQEDVAVGQAAGFMGIEVIQRAKTLGYQLLIDSGDVGLQNFVAFQVI